MAELKNMILASAFSLRLVRFMRGRIRSERLQNLIEVVLSPIGFLRYLFACDTPCDPEVHLAIAAIIRNEAPYLREWIEFHRLLGVEEFYLYDNESEDDIEDVIAPYLTKGIVYYEKIKGKKRQCDAYNDVLSKYADRARYIAFLDVDEFLMPADDSCLTDTLDNIMAVSEKIGGCVVNWLCYGSSGYEHKPEGLVTECYTMRGTNDFEANANYKSIVEPGKVFSFTCPHYPVYKRGYYAVDEKGECVNTPLHQGTWDRLRINHYFTKSREEYRKKMSRGMADRTGFRTMEDFYRHDVNDVEDKAALRWQLPDVPCSLTERIKNRWVEL